MPRSSGGRKGSFPSCSSHPDVHRRNVAATVVLSSDNKAIISYLTRDSASCQVVFDQYEECVKKEHCAGSCDFIRELRESCSRFKRDPRRENMFERQKRWEESIQREATAAGFASVDEYQRYKRSKSRAMCRIAYTMYKECISRDPTDKTCDVHRLDCPQFRS